MENFSYKSGQTLIIHENGEIKIIFNGVNALIMTPDELVDFWQVCGYVANRIVRESPIEMGWKPNDSPIASPSKV